MNIKFGKLTFSIRTLCTVLLCYIEGPDWSYQETVLFDNYKISCLLQRLQSSRPSFLNEWLKSLSLYLYLMVSRGSHYRNLFVGGSGFFLFWISSTRKSILLSFLFRFYLSSVEAAVEHIRGGHLNESIESLPVKVCTLKSVYALKIWKSILNYETIRTKSIWKFVEKIFGPKQLRTSFSPSRKNCHLQCWNCWERFS